MYGCVSLEELHSESNLTWRQMSGVAISNHLEIFKEFVV